MGIRGSAIATVIAWGIRAVMLTSVFLSDRFNRQFRTRPSWRFDAARLRSILSIGWPIALQWVLDIGSWWVFLQFIMGRFGEKTMAASNISMQLMHFSFMPAIGVGISVCSLVGHAIGERRPELALRLARIGLSITMVYMGVMALLFLLIPGPLVGLFQKDPEVVRLGCVVLLWGAIFQVFDAAQITYINALRGTGDTLVPAILVASHCWIVFIAGGLVVARLWPGWGLNGPWMMCTLYIILLGLILHRRWTRGGWRKIKLFREAAPRGAFPVVPVEEPTAPPTG
jgi:MATE family multidrug resistance protein